MKRGRLDAVVDILDILKSLPSFADAKAVLDTLASMQLNRHIEQLMEPTELRLNESPFHLCLPDESPAAAQETER